MATTQYGLTKVNMEYHRALLALRYPHDYIMAQLAQTYRTRKVIYDTPTRGISANWVHSHIDRLPKRL